MSWTFTVVVHFLLGGLSAATVHDANLVCFAALQFTQHTAAHCTSNQAASDCRNVHSYDSFHL